MTPNIIDSLPPGIIDSLPPPTPTGEHWARYVELLTLKKPTVGQQREFAELVKALQLTPNKCKLHQIIIAAAQNREDLIRDLDEQTLQRADMATHQAEEVARQQMLDEVGTLLRKLQTNDFPETRAHSAARDAVRNFLFVRDELQGIYGRWPCLFGLPQTTNCHGRPSSTVPPDDILAAATALGINCIIFQD